jgi:hypothetical protein
MMIGTESRWICYVTAKAKLKRTDGIWLQFLGMLLLIGGKQKCSPAMNNITADIAGGKIRRHS